MVTIGVFEGWTAFTWLLYHTASPNRIGAREKDLRKALLALVCVLRLRVPDDHVSHYVPCIPNAHHHQHEMVL